jgi:hypothetical protein
MASAVMHEIKTLIIFGAVTYAAVMFLMLLVLA